MSLNDYHEEIFFLLILIKDTLKSQFFILARNFNSFSYIALNMSSLLIIV